MKEIMENNIYISYDDNGNLLLKIEKLENNIYHAKNKFSDIVAEIYSVDDYKTNMKLISNKEADKRGCYRNNKTLADHNLMWLAYMVEKVGFIRKSKPVK